MKRPIIILLLCIISLINEGCSVTQKNITINNPKITVAVSIVPQEAFIKKIAEDLVEVITIIPNGSSPTNYEPSPKELEQLSRASLLFTIGVPTESANILPKIENINKNIKIVNLDKIVSREYPDRFFGYDKNDNARDPHIWLSIKRAKVIVRSIANELSELDPKNKRFYQVNAENYIKELDETNKEIYRELSKVIQKKFIVYHPSLGYFAEDYGLTMIAIEKEGKKATIQQLEEVISMAKEENIRAVFYQAETDDKQAKVISKEINGRSMQIEILSSNYIENLLKISNAIIEAAKIIE